MPPYRPMTGESRCLKAMRGLLVAALAMLFGSGAAMAQDGLVDAAMLGAAHTLELALPKLDAVTMGVQVDQYRAALAQRRFTSSAWNRALDLQVVINPSEQGLCAGYAAYVTPAIEQNAMALVICPQFFTPGADALRQTTILHEMVHVVAGTNECQAMAFTAQVQQLATGSFQPVMEYWNRNNCAASRYRLPN